MVARASAQLLRAVEPAADCGSERTDKGSVVELCQEPAPASRQHAEKDELRKVMGQYATGAAIIAGSWNGQPHGMAVNSFTSVSLQPPMILFCPDKRSETWPPIWRSGHFTVNILGCDQDDLCRKFAKKGEDRFANTPYVHCPTGSPVLRDAVAFLECRIERVHDAGDHFITVGRVLALAVQHQAPPLVFYQGGFHQLAGVEQPGVSGVASR